MDGSTETRTHPMSQPIPQVMKAAVIDRFGGPEVLHMRELPVPIPGKDELLIRLDTAGIGVWDPYVRAGERSEGKPRFLPTIGNDGAGNAVAAGDGAKRFSLGPPAYAPTMNGGFDTGLIRVRQAAAAPIPPPPSPAE